LVPGVSDYFNSLAITGGARGFDVAVNWLSEVSAVAPEWTVSGGAALILLDSARQFLRQADAGFPNVRSALAPQELAPARQLFLLQIPCFLPPMNYSIKPGKTTNFSQKVLTLLLLLYKK
jgi:hypothetical protein